MSQDSHMEEKPRAGCGSGGSAQLPRPLWVHQPPSCQSDHQLGSFPNLIVQEFLLRLP